MFVNPIVSANDCTGYTAKAPLTDEEAEAKSCIVNVPTTKYSIKEEKSLQPHHSSNVKNQSEHKKS